MSHLLGYGRAEMGDRLLCVVCGAVFEACGVTYRDRRLGSDSLQVRQVSGPLVCRRQEAKPMPTEGPK